MRRSAASGCTAICDAAVPPLRPGSLFTVSQGSSNLSCNSEQACPMSRCPQLLPGLPEDLLAAGIAALLPPADRQDERLQQAFCLKRLPGPFLTQLPFTILQAPPEPRMSSPAGRLHWVVPRGAGGPRRGHRRRGARGLAAAHRRRVCACPRGSAVRISTTHKRNHSHGCRGSAH